MGSLIGVIVPVYNVKPFLRECLDSIVLQEYRNLEIILVDDGSTDGCGSICDAYSETDSRVTVYHTPNRGLSAARNYGLDHLSADVNYVFFADGDDWIEKDAIQKLYAAVKQNNADVGACRYYVERLNGRDKVSSLGHAVVLDGNQILKHFITTGNIDNVAWNKLYRRDLFDSVRYPVGAAFEDVATTYKLLAKAKRVVVIPDLLMHYRTRQNSLSRNYSMKVQIDFWKAHFERLLALSEMFPDPEYLQPLIRDCLSVVNRMWRCYGGFSKEEQRIADPTLEEMQAFVAEHRSNILRERFYSMNHKLTSICAMCRNPLYMRALNRMYRGYLYFERKKWF